MKRLSLLVVAFSGSFLLGQESVKPPPPTHTNVSYGPHARNVLDFWQAPGEGMRPLLVYIHGGGWTGGDKGDAYNPYREWVPKGVSVAAINYRFTPTDPLPAPVHDAARAIQFLRSKSAAWKIDSGRIAATGISAGGCTSMWLLCHDDMADPKAKDPIARESTRVAGTAASRGQTSINPKQIEPWLGPNVLTHRMIPMAVGEKTMEAALCRFAKYERLYVEFSPITHVSKDDPPLFMTYGDDDVLPSKNASHGIHHPVFGIKMKEAADRVGMDCHLLLGRGAKVKSATYKDANHFLEVILLKDDVPQKP